MKGPSTMTSTHPIGKPTGSFLQLALLAVGAGVGVSLLAAGVVLFITTVGV